MKSILGIEAICILPQQPKKIPKKCFGVLSVGLVLLVFLSVHFSLAASDWQRHPEVWSLKELTFDSDKVDSRHW